MCCFVVVHCRIKIKDTEASARVEDQIILPDPFTPRSPFLYSDKQKAFQMLKVWNHNSITEIVTVQHSKVLFQHSDLGSDLM